jgi:hypothetical protein
LFGSDLRGLWSLLEPDNFLPVSLLFDILDLRR